MEHETNTKAARSLWGNGDFVKLWLGQTVSKFGSHITYAAIAATAVLMLRATPAQMGVLGAVEGAALLVFGLFAGVWVDRVRRRPILIATDIGRAFVLASDPCAWWLGCLSMAWLYAVAGVVGVLTVFFGVADRSALPSLVTRAELVEANSKLGASESVAEIGGQAIGGTLVQVLSAPLAIFIDAASYLFSAVCIGLIHTPEPPPAAPLEEESAWREGIAGLRSVLQHPLLRVLAGCAALMHFFGGFIGALYWLYLVRELHMTPAFVGLWVGCGGIGSLVGALIAGRVTRRFGVGPTMAGAMLYASVVGIYIPLVRGPASLVMPVLLGGQLLGDIAWPLYEVNAMSLRQSSIPHHLLGRVNAAMDLISQGPGPLGALVGGLLAGSLGVRETLWIAWAGFVTASLWLALSPVRRVAALPDAEEDVAGGVVV